MLYVEWKKKHPDRCLFCRGEATHRRNGLVVYDDTALLNRRNDRGSSSSRRIKIRRGPRKAFSPLSSIQQKRAADVMNPKS